MMRWLRLFLRLLLAAVFLYAAWSKLRQPWLLFAMSIDSYQLLPPWAVLLAWTAAAYVFGRRQFDSNLRFDLQAEQATHLSAAAFAEAAPNVPDRMNVRYVITEGNQQFVKQVIVTGAQHTRPYVIQRELTLAAGHPLSQLVQVHLRVGPACSRHLLQRKREGVQPTRALQLVDGTDETPGYRGMGDLDLAVPTDALASTGEALGDTGSRLSVGISRAGEGEIGGSIDK